MMRHAVLARAVAGPRPRPVPLVALVALLALLSVAAPAASPVAELWAQAPTPRAPGAERGAWTRVRVAKWALLGATVGFGLYALSHSTRAERDYDDLRRLCVAEPASCTLEEGRYEAAAAEALYQSSVREDRRAQVGIVAGEVALLGSVGLFVYDLRNGRGPANIPYPAGSERVAPRRAFAVGAALRF